MLVYVHDQSGANPRRKPKRRKPQYRREMWEYGTVTGNYVTAESAKAAQHLAYLQGFGEIIPK